MVRSSRASSFAAADQETGGHVFTGQASTRRLVAQAQRMQGVAGAQGGREGPSRIIARVGLIRGGLRQIGHRG